MTKAKQSTGKQPTTKQPPKNGKRPKAPTRSPRDLLFHHLNRVATAMNRVQTERWLKRFGFSDEFKRNLSDAFDSVEAAMQAAQELPADWEPPKGSGGRRNGIAVGDYVQPKVPTLFYGSLPYKVVSVGDGLVQIDLGGKSGLCVLKRGAVKPCTSPAA